GFGPNDYGAPIDEWRDGTYRLSVRVVVEDWSKPGASVSVSNDPAEDLFLSVRNGAIAAVSRSAAAPGYEIHADVVAAYDGPASLPPHQRNVSGRFFMAGRGPQMPDAVRVTLPDGTVRMLPRYTDVFSPGTDWVTQFRFGASFPERPWPGKYVFAGLDAAGVPIPGIEAAVSVAGSRPPDPPAGVSVWASPEGLMVTWQPVPVVPGTFDPDRGIGFYQLTVLQPEAAIMVYGAGQMRGTSHLVPRTRGEFSPNSLGSPIQEWPDGTYHLFVVANAEENEGSLVSSEDSRRNVVLTVQGGAVVRVEGAAASTSTSTPRRINVLSDAFEGGAAGVWSDRTTDASNRDQFTEFLGRFTNDTVSLTLQNLPPHDLVELTFDLYVIDSWDGSNYRSGPDYFQVGSGGSRDNLFSETFHSGCPGEGMSYAATRPESCGPDLGFNPIYGDSIYRNLNNGFTFGHTGSTLVINFSGSGLQDVEDESWGIDNVRITLVSGP
ncbi:MAG: hypothetical protein FJ313_06985, partial [Gemmatimonadetes bacterium]|nr:hypothetical protein [Gemmatimonadota bacterium]